jgi:hypothetical protein
MPPIRKVTSTTVGHAIMKEIAERWMVVRRLPEVCIVLWVVFLGTTIWGHIRITHQPPIYDTLGYWWKAYNFWQAVHQGQIFNPLNLEPTIRPPGTVLMAYPLGFNPDPRGLYFRSIFFPAVLLVLAVLVAIYEPRSSPWERWRVALIAAFFSTPAIVYWFAVIPAPMPSSWGMVDSFMMGVAALAAAAAWRSVLRASVIWFTITAILSSFCILIKPSGTLVAALIALMWAFLAYASIRYRGATSLPGTQRTAVLRWFAAGAVIIAAVDLAVLGAAVHSGYLSQANIAVGRAAIAVMSAEMRVPVSGLLTLVHTGPGDALTLWMVLAIATAAVGWISPKSRRGQPGDAMLHGGAAVAAILAVASGLWFWLMASGGGWIRYGMPFFMIAMVFAVPAFTWFAAYVPRVMVACSMAVTLAAVVNFALLLAQPNPALAWQGWTGINLSAGRSFDGIGRFQRFVDAPRTTATFVYSLDATEADEIFSSLVLQRWIVHPELPSLWVRRPSDWQRPTTYRIDEILSSHYLLFEPERNPTAAASALANVEPNSVESERSLFVAWASGLRPADGVDVVVDLPSARIVQIRDKTALGKSLRRMLSGRHWRTVFTDANEPALVQLDKQEPDLGSPVATR